MVGGNIILYLYKFFYCGKKLGNTASASLIAAFQKTKGGRQIYVVFVYLPYKW
jgi:hypothetical protein